MPAENRSKYGPASLLANLTGLGRGPAPQTSYNYKVVRQFAIMTIVWGVVGMLVGVFIAAQLLWPELNLAPWLSYGPRSCAAMNTPTSIPTTPQTMVMIANCRTTL